MLSSKCKGAAGNQYVLPPLLSGSISGGVDRWMSDDTAFACSTLPKQCLRAVGEEKIIDATAWFEKVNAELSRKSKGGTFVGKRMLLESADYKAHFLISDSEHSFAPKMQAQSVSHLVCLEMTMLQQNDLLRKASSSLQRHAIVTHITYMNLCRSAIARTTEVVEETSDLRGVKVAKRKAPLSNRELPFHSG